MDIYSYKHNVSFRPTVIIYIALVIDSLYTCPVLVLSVSLSLMLRLKDCAIAVGIQIRRYCVMNHIARSNWCFNH